MPAGTEETNELTIHLHAVQQLSGTRVARPNVPDQPFEVLLSIVMEGSHRWDSLGMIDGDRRRSGYMTVHVLLKFLKIGVQ